jgi:hypothetical protein
MATALGARAGGAQVHAGADRIASNVRATPAGGRDEAMKLLAQVRLYLSSAIDNARVLHRTAMLAPGPNDASLCQEGIANLQRDVGRSRLYFERFTAAALGATARAEAAPIEAELDQARRDIDRLAWAGRTDVREIAALLFARLASIDTALADLADRSGVPEADVPHVEPVPAPQKLPDVPPRSKPKRNPNPLQPLPAPPEHQVVPPLLPVPNQPSGR